MDSHNISDELENIATLEKMIRKGVVDTSVVNRMTQYRISTVQEMISARVIVENISGLHADNNEFIENPWGFPFMPVPLWANAAVDGSTGMRLAPKNISYEWFGHPIYWVDPELTRMSEAELKDPPRWCVRMYILLTALGLYKRDPSTGQVLWVNALRASGVNYTEEDWLSYKRGYDVPQTNGVRFGVETLERHGLNRERVNEEVAQAMKVIEDKESTHLARYNSLRKRAFEDGLMLLGAKVVGAQGEKNEPKWKPLVAQAGLLTKSVHVAVKTGDLDKVAELVDPIFANANEIIKLVGEMSSVTAILKAPILRDMVANRLQFACMATTLATGAGQRTRSAIRDQVNSAAGKLAQFSIGDDERDVMIYHQVVSKLIQDHLQDLQLQARNTMRVEEGKSPYATIHHMKAAELGSANRD